MTGKYDIELYNATVHYFLTVKRNITVLQGNSASGKSELVRLLMDFGRSGESSGITLICEKPCTVLTAEDWELRLAHMSGRIIFIDDGSSFVRTEEFARAIMGSDNYFVIINRDSLYELPYSIHEIYGLREADHSRYKNAEQVYNEMYQISCIPHFLIRCLRRSISLRRIVDRGSNFFQRHFRTRSVRQAEKVMS